MMRRSKWNGSFERGEGSQPGTRDSCPQVAIPEKIGPVALRISHIVGISSGFDNGLSPA